MTKLSLLLAITLLSHGSITNFGLKHWRTDPEVRIEDAYKWLYQATRGAEHAVTDEKEARAWLEREWQTLGKPSPDEPLWEPLRPDEAIGRLNLRPFRARGGRSEDLLAAFIETAKTYHGNEGELKREWRALKARLSRHSEGRLSLSEWKRLDKELIAQNYPAIHHSSEYNAARKPAYRVLTKEAYEKLLQQLPIQNRF